MGLFSWLLAALTDRRVAAFQSDLMAKHVREVENIYRQMRGWRHDYHNHIQALKAHLHLRQYEQIGAYLDGLDKDLGGVDTLVKSGNVMVDAILNSKLSIAASRQIAVSAKALVPKELPVSEIDLCVILGNLIDNATEACVTLPNRGDRFLRVYVDIMKGQLYISVTNSVSGTPKRSGRTYLTTKATAGHGFGLMRVDKIAAKYGGFVNRQSEQGVFATEIMLPLAANIVV